jgi:hypothetical protein
MTIEEQLGIHANMRQEIPLHFQGSFLLFPVICPQACAVPDLSVWQDWIIRMRTTSWRLFFSCYLHERQSMPDFAHLPELPKERARLESIRDTNAETQP